MLKRFNKDENPRYSFWRGLMAFMKKYSVIGLAIGVITAQASKDLVDAIVMGVFTPLIKLIIPGGLSSLVFRFHGQVFNIGIILNAALTFIIVMTFLYFIIKAILRNDELLENSNN